MSADGAKTLGATAARVFAACAAAMAGASVLFAACTSSSTNDAAPADAQGDAPSSESDTGSVDGEDGMSDGATDAGPTRFRYVVVLVKENHTFDNLFGAFPGADGTLEASLSDGGTLTRPTIPPGRLATNPAHDHDAGVIAYHDGGMNGFDLASPPTGDDPLMTFRYYPQSLVPNYFALASQYALCDAFFSGVLGGSFPGYLSLIAAQSPAYENPGGSVWRCGASTTVPVFDPKTCATSVTAPCFSIPSIVDHLPDGITWRSYTDRYEPVPAPIASPFDAIDSVYAKGTADHTRLNRALLSDLAAGDLANITYVWGGNQSEHPPDDICPGENDTVAIATALMNGPHWNETLLIVTWDDWGGFYDHVAPKVDPCSAGGGPFHHGFRVPALLISPYTKKGLVYHTPTEQASVPRLIEDVFGLPRMASFPGSTARDDVAGDLLGAFDFTQPPQPGLVLTPRTCP